MEKVRNKKNEITSPSDGFTFGKKNYVMLLAGIGLLFLGYFFMMGAELEDVDVFDEEKIYGFRHVVLPTLLCISGFCLTFYSIFIKK